VRIAIQRDIPRWFLAHRDLELVFDLVRNLGHKIPDDVPTLNAAMDELRKKGRTPLVDDFNVLTMYAEVVQAKTDITERKGNWAQPFYTDDDGQIFVKAQFLRHTEAVKEIKDGPLSALRQMSQPGGKSS
jgi:hypothetical protein